MDNWSFSLSKLLMLLTLVMVEVALCPPDNSIGSFPNFWFIIDDMGLLFFRGGACNGTLERERERKKKHNEIDLYLESFLFSPSSFTFEGTLHCRRRISGSFSSHERNDNVKLLLYKKARKKAQNLASEHFINVAKCIVNRKSTEKRCAKHATARKSVCASV